MTEGKVACYEISSREREIRREAAQDASRKRETKLQRRGASSDFSLNPALTSGTHGEFQSSLDTSPMKFRKTIATERPP